MRQGESEEWVAMVGLVADLKKWGQLRQGESEGWVAMGGLVADLKKRGQLLEQIFLER